jgi:16S rRNA (guanine527-N7)-methyltransferase
VQSEDPIEAVAATADRLGRPVVRQEAEKLARFFELLLDWNRKINLTGARSLKALLAEHFPDSVALARLVPPGRSVLDVGSGGGLPGVPFAILRPDARLTLLEPRSRRVAFLRTALRELGIAGTVDPERLEAVTRTYDVLSARAVLPPDSWASAATPHLAPDGRIVVYLPDTRPWAPPPPLAVVDSVRYAAGRTERLAIALSVPRGT